MTHPEGTLLDTERFRYLVGHRNKRNQHYMVSAKFGPDRGAWMQTWESIRDWDQSVGKHGKVVR